MTRNAVRFSQIVSSDSEAENGSDLRSCPIVSSKRPQRFSARAARPSLSSRTGNRATTSGYGSNENKIRAKEEGEEEDEDEDLLARQLTATVSQRENVRKVSRTSSSTSSSAKPRVARKMNRRDEVATTSIINKYFKKDSESKPPFQKGIVTDDTDDDVVVGMPKVPIRPQSVSPTAKILSSTKAGSPIPLVRRRDPVQKSIYSFFGEGANSMYNNHGSLSSLPSGGLETSPSNEDLDGKKSFFTQPDENVGDGVSHPLVSSSRTTSSEDAVNGLSRDLSPEAPVNTAPSSPPTSPEPIPEEVSRKFPTRSTRNRQPKFIEAISDIEESDRGDHSDFIDPSSDETNSDIEPDISEDDSDDSDIKPCAKRLKLSESADNITSSEHPASKIMASFNSDDNDENHFTDESDTAVIRLPKAKAKAPPTSTTVPKRKPRGRQGSDAKDQKAKESDSFNYEIGIDLTLPPISKNSEIFADMLGKALDNGLVEALRHLGKRKLRVATMCSGTESPILAMKLFEEDLKSRNLGLDFGIDHVFSAEIVVFKQAYIERNFSPPIIFKDIRELGVDGATTATTAYGSEVSIPENVDMLIAGFSCVDFSALNNKKKNLSDGGESGDTLTAILKYANRYRPKIMILENVKGADWNHIKKVLVPDIGYCAEFSNSIDTKHYYLPQTRQRGYMVCIDRHLSKKLKLDPTRLVSDAMEKMGELKRPASSPVQAFLLDEDDPRIVRGHADMVDGGRGDNKRGNVDWTRCYGRHQDARTEHALGQMRPVMRWEDGGTCYPRDNMWIDWAKKQVERIWDLIDLFSLLSVKRGFDLEYKGRILDLSQNVDRGWDRTKAGLTPCLTPNGIPFSSWHGRPLVGLEVLALNALPINKLQFVLETQSMLQDLAGNAMTSTVVGAMILAVLSSAYPILESGEHSMEEDRSTLLSSICGEDDLVPLDCDIAHYPPLAVATAMQLAGKSRRLCLCEGQSVITSAQVQECGFCNHTTCVKCGGNPNHKYRPILRQVVDQRLLPIRFEELLKESLPMKVTIGGHSLDDINALRPASVAAEERWKPVFDRICKAFNSELRYYRVKRSHVWTVYYECEHARLELKLDSELAEWQLFAKPDASESGDSHVRKVLLQPVARMRPRRDGNDLLKGAWEICTMQTFAFDAQISGVGDLIKSFVASRGLADFIDTETFQAYSISVDDEDSIKRLDIDIRGIYEALPNCGGALGSLHRRQDDTKSAARMFFFLDPHPINHPTQDFFVFSHEKSRLRHDEARQTIARVDCSWRPPRIEKIKGTTSPVVTYRVDGKNKPCTEVELRQPRKVRFYSDGHWIDLDGAHLRPIGGTEAASYKCAPSNFSIEPPSDSCQSAHVVLSCKSVLPKYVKSPWQGKGLVEVDKNDHQDFFAAYTWLTEKVRVLPGLGDWKEVEGADAVRCHRCAPVLPKIRWTLGKDDKLFPVEDPREALPYERTIKARPSALVVQVSIDSDGHTELKLAVNPETLMHRALAKLPVSDSHRVTLSWRLVTDWIPPSKISPPEFRIPSNENGGMANQPPGFKKPLRPEQLESLKWMLDQEAERVIPFMEEEVEEATIPQIGWRAEGRGTIPVFIRGGVLADEVGFGKTITTLALIASHRDRDSKAAKLAISSRIPVKATLILVPDHIIMQWYDATRDFLSHADYKVVTIKKMADLEKRTIREFQEADIIIVSWNLLKIDTYFFRLAEFSGLLELPANAGTRAEATWYERALEKVSQHTGKLQQDGKGLKDMIEASLQASREEALRQETFTPSKRLRGRAYQNAKQAKSAGQKRTADEMSKVRGAKNQNAFEKPIQRGDPFGLYPITQGKRSWSTMKCPLLELFEFSRLVVDEYTYVSGNHSTIMCNLQAKSRWVLSGTPPLEDFADVKSISKFLGINLGVDDLTTVVTKSANIKALSKDRTGSEEFRFLKQTQSAAWHDNRHRIAQRFLDHFARQNKAKIGTLPKSDHILSIRQPAAERALYLELVQILAATNFSIKKGRANVDNDRARRIHELVGSSDSATEALLKCASHFTLEDLNDGSTTALQACDVIVAVRQKQYIKLKAAFESKLMQTEWLCRTTELPCIQYTNWKRSIDENNLGDRETADEIKALYQNAERNFKENHGRIFYVTAEKAKTKDKNELRRIMPEPGNTHILELRNRVADLGNLRRELLARKRALRFFKSVRLLQRLYSERSEQVIQATCSCSVCHKKHGSSQSFSVQTLCGHIICDTCVSHRTPESTCGVSGCGAVNKDYQVLSAHELGKDDDHVGKHYGKKIESLVSLIKNIDKTEQVLVFVQFPDLMKKINTAFEDHNISFTELRTAKIQSSELNAFQHGDKKMGKKQVLILNLGDASASGSNLTGANHVVFVSPCLTERQQTYDAQMTQAIGRALRYGQTKHVHVYHYLTLNTVDVDTIQARTGKMLKKGCDNDPLNVYKAPFESFSPSGLALLDAMPGDSGEFGSMIAGLVDEVED